MQRYLNIIWSDLKLYMYFVLPMVPLAVPASLAGAWFAKKRYGENKEVKLWQSAALGVVAGPLFVLWVSIVAEMVLPHLWRNSTFFEVPDNHLLFFMVFGPTDDETRQRFEAYGDSLLSRILFEQILFNAGAGILAAAFAFAIGFAMTRQAAIGDRTKVRNGPWRFSLRQLLLVQLAIAIALGCRVPAWQTTLMWSQTTHAMNETRVRNQTRLQEARKVFGPYGWEPTMRSEWGNDSELTLGLVVNEQQVTDDTLDLVVRERDIERLVVRSNQVTDDGLRRLAASTSLRSIKVRSNEITDAGIAALCRLPLTQVEICSDRISGESLSHLRGLKSLRSLTIYGPNQISVLDLEEFRRSRTDVSVQTKPLDPWYGW